MRLRLHTAQSKHGQIAAHSWLVGQAIRSATTVNRSEHRVRQSILVRRESHRVACHYIEFQALSDSQQAAVDDFVGRRTVKYKRHVQTVAVNVSEPAGD